MIQGYNPRTGQPTGEPVAETTDADVDAAVAAAAEALPAWASLDDEARAHALEALADALDERAAELVALADEETALGETRLTGEVGRTTGQLRLFAGVLRDGGYHDVADSPAGGGIGEIGRISHAIGPVVVFAASNFPFAFSVLGGDTASALAAGCPVVVKAHEGHPNTSELTAQIAHEVLAKAGAPHGVFALVHGVDAGLRLLKHPDIAAAGFTGSTSGGALLPAGMSSFTAWVWIGRVTIRSTRRTSITSISGVVFISTMTSPSAVPVLIAMTNYLKNCWLPASGVR